MIILKLVLMTAATILLSLFVQLPIYLGIRLFNENLVLKLTIEVSTFLLLLGGLGLVRIWRFYPIPKQKQLPLKTTVAWTIVTFLLETGGTPS